MSECENAVEKVEERIGIICNWMANNFLKVNEDKSAVLFLGSHHMLNSLSKPSIDIGEEEITDNNVTSVQSLTPL